MPQRVYPFHEEVDEIYSDLILPDESPRDATLPYVVINMVSSLDGKASADGKSGAIGSEADRTAMRVLRSKVDAVMSGSGTLRAERVSLTSEGRRTPEPLAIIPSMSLDLPLENLLGNIPERTLILTTGLSLIGKEHELEQIKRSATVVICDEDEDRNLDYAAALRKLKSEYAVENILVEGGPSLNRRLISHEPNLVNELFLTLAPKLLGGTRETSHTIVEGSLETSGIRPRLISIHTSDESELFLRYEITPPTPDQSSPPQFPISIIPGN